MDVAKYSPAHTSVQWTAEAARTCREKAELARAGGGYLLRCTALDASIDEAVARGDIEMSLRSDPSVIRLPGDPAPSR
ncbi:hypothetical protein JK386_00340 [Nocardioides sp. zg-536]|uniref:Uncharacterized protein n=1 Tax=Nocardioides faecalis TaxID=2803858 RepID=A0A938Y6E0_9ACTN|nr:hypothetical protein [Nocardioides faecalis]MBM9458346.1 hypothetical protein [Nocardioides faecalis]MBS4753353.1 hypothetical protein [Nocardioides faecalis]QVI58371.1 hypothetical protein KG111_15420 [Nocardioides faecalis]